VHERPKAEIERLLAVMNRLTDEMVVADTRTLIQTLRAEPGSHQGRAGCSGYCMGGRHVVRVMAQLPELFAAGCAHYPTYVVTDVADAPYRSLGQAQGSFYVCIGGQDWLMSAQTIARLREALQQSGCQFEFKVHPDAGHGYSFPEKGAIYQHDAAEYDWQRCIELFRAVL